MAYASKILIFSRQNKIDHFSEIGIEYPILMLPYFLMSDGIKTMNIRMKTTLNLNEKFHAKNFMKFWILMRI